MTLQPPGTPPPPGDSSGPSRGGDSDDWSVYLLNILMRNGGRVERRRLYRWSGLSASQFADWLAAMTEQKILDLQHADGDEIVVLTQRS